jgi:hypothetical protein
MSTDDILNSCFSRIFPGPLRARAFACSSAFLWHIFNTVCIRDYFYAFSVARLKARYFRSTDLLLILATFYPPKNMSTLVPTAHATLCWHCGDPCEPLPSNITVRGSSTAVRISNFWTHAQTRCTLTPHIHIHYHVHISLSKKERRSLPCRLCQPHKPCIGIHIKRSIAYHAPRHSINTVKARVDKLQQSFAHRVHEIYIRVLHAQSDADASMLESIQ